MDHHQSTPPHIAIDLESLRRVSDDVTRRRQAHDGLCDAASQSGAGVKAPQPAPWIAQYLPFIRDMEGKADRGHGFFRDEIRGVRAAQSGARTMARREEAEAGLPKIEEAAQELADRALLIPPHRADDAQLITLLLIERLMPLSELARTPESRRTLEATLFALGNLAAFHGGDGAGLPNATSSTLPMASKQLLADILEQRRQPAPVREAC